jgi:inhibitor of cysteine peptidase
LTCTAIFLVISSYAFVKTYVDSRNELKIHIEQKNRNDMVDTIKAAVDKTFVITMDANATTGYEWQLAGSIDDSLIGLVRSEYVPHKTGLVGSGGKSIWTFKAIRAGKAQIAFKYVRPWEKDIPPVKQAMYTVDIRD